MATDGRTEAIIETSVLINFLKIGRTDLLGRHPAYRFVVIDYVKAEITTHYGSQLAMLEAALQSGELLPDIPPDQVSMQELSLFASMASAKIGTGERAAIAAAVARGLPLAMDDERAWKRATAFCPGVARESTVSLMVSLIKGGVVDVAAADVIKADWEANHRFRLRFASFAERI